MRKAISLGVALLTATAAMAAISGSPIPTPAVLPEPGFRQNWIGQPVLPPVFEEQDPPSPREPGSSDEPLPMVTPQRWEQTPQTAPGAEESQFPKLLDVLDLNGWRRQDELRRVREKAGDLLFGVPLFVPQFILEEFIPRGVPVGPTTFLYRTPKDSKTLPLVVFDQAVFHEGEFLSQVDAARAGGPPDALTHIEKHVLRRSLMSGFRANYAFPNMSLDLILETAAEQGVWGYLLVPTAGGALLFLKGLDQKFSIDDVLKARVVITSGRQWMHSVHASEGLPAFSCELKFFDLPVGIIISMDMSSRGMSAQFIGVGTSLGAVEDLLGLEENRARRPGD